MDSNREMILKELTDFEKNADEIEEIPEILNKYLDNVARSGDIIFKWDQFKPLIKKKIQLVVSDFNEHHPCDPNLTQPNVKPFDFEEVKRNILSGIDSFSGAPFTIQRICELLTNPYKHYKRADKFMKGLEKNVMVISEETVDLKTENGNDSNNSICLNSTFTLPSTSDSINQSTAFHNGYKEESNDEHQILSHQPTNTTPSTIQQLDSFTTVFVSSSSQTSTHLDRIANLPILESTNHNSSQLPTCLASSSNITITPIDTPLSTDPALDNLEKMTTELPIVEPVAATTTVSSQQLTTDIIIETVNSEDEQIQLNTNCLESNNEKIVLIQEVEEEDNKCSIDDQQDIKPNETLNTINNISIEVIKEDESNEQANEILNKDQSNVSIEISSEKEEQKDEQLEIKDTTASISESIQSDSFESSTKEPESNDLKRTHEEVGEEEDVDESFKRFKTTNNDLKESSIDEENVAELSTGDSMNENVLDEIKSDTKSEIEQEIKLEIESEIKEKTEQNEQQSENKITAVHSSLPEDTISDNQSIQSTESTKLSTDKNEKLLNDKILNELETESESNSDNKQENTIDT